MRELGETLAAAPLIARQCPLVLGPVFELLGASEVVGVGLGHVAHVSIQPEGWGTVQSPKLVVLTEGTGGKGRGLKTSVCHLGSSEYTTYG